MVDRKAIRLMGNAASDWPDGPALRRGLPEAKAWLESAATDPEHAEAVERAINPTGRPNMKWSPPTGRDVGIDSAPFDCLGRVAID